MIEYCLYVLSACLSFLPPFVYILLISNLSQEPLVHAGILAFVLGFLLVEIDLELEMGDPSISIFAWT